MGDENINRFCVPNVHTQDIQSKIETVIADMEKWNGRCGYTVMINMWMDRTDSIECRHGTKDVDGNIVLYRSIYYDNKLTRKIQYMDKNQKIISEEIVNE